MASMHLLPLKAACVATVLFGAGLLLAPGPGRALFSLILYGDSGRIDTWPPEVRHYVTLVHGILGAVMLGWALLMLGVLDAGRSVRSGGPARPAWWLVGASVGAWYLADTSFSLVMGAWQNALLNTGFAALFALGVAVARRTDQPASA
jgi:hypothetical protein